MEIQQIDLSNRKDVKAFLDLPFRLYRDTPQWVPPLQMEARQMLDRRKNPFFRHSQAAFYMALSGGGPVGRLAVLDHRLFNEHNHERTAFFYLFECEDDSQAAQGLFEAGFAWARERGLERILGPKGFTPFDGMGLLVSGFEHRPAFGIPYNLPYYPALIEAAGFQTAGEIVSGYLDAAKIEFPERFHQVAAKVAERRGLRIVQFKRRKDLQMLVPRLQELYNLSIEGTAGNYPVRDEDVKAIAETLLRFADPRLIKIILKGEQIVGFLFAYPDISAALQRSKGRLFPFGWAQMLLEMRRTEWVNINGMGILAEYRGLGGPAILFSEMQKSIQGRFRQADLVQMGSDNDKMLRELRDLGVEYYKVHRMYCREM